jgi:hypothetical protein
MPSRFRDLRCVILSDIPDRSSIIFGVFLAFGNMIFAIVRAYSPSLFFFSIFGTVATDIFCVRDSLISIHVQTPIVVVVLSVYRSALPLCKLSYPRQYSHGCVCLLRNGARLLFCFLSGDREPRIPWLVIRNSWQGEGNAHVAGEFAFA